MPSPQSAEGVGWRHKKNKFGHVGEGTRLGSAPGILAAGSVTD